MSATRREHIQTAVEAGGRRTAAPHEAWIAADPFVAAFGCSSWLTALQELIQDAEPATVTQRIVLDLLTSASTATAIAIDKLHLIRAHVANRTLKANKVRIHARIAA